MKILVVSSIKEGEIGGPGLYAQNLPAALSKHGVEARVLRPGEFFVLVWLAPRYNILYSLSGSPKINIPLLLCAKIFRKKFLIRPGGDFLWERAIESGRTQSTLKEYYESEEYRKNIFSILLFSLALSGADKIIFPTHYLKNLYQEYFSIIPSQSEVVDYPYPDVKLTGSDPVSFDKKFIFAGRLIKFKNLERLIRAFSQVNSRQGAVLEIIGDGPEKQKLHGLVRDLGSQDYIHFSGSANHEDLLRKMGKSYCAIVPSIFEPGSFFILECVKLGVPVIFTKEAGLYEKYKDKLVFVDPLSEGDIKAKIEFLLNKENYRNYADKIRGIDTSRGWRDVASEHAEIFKTL